MWDNFRNTLNFDDLLFESRNKAYGAYQLRKKYNSVLIGGIILGSLIMCSLIILPFVLTQNNDKVLRGAGQYVQVQMQNFEVPPEEILVPPPPPPPEIVRIPETVIYIPPVVVDTILPSQPALATIDEIMTQTPSEVTTITGTGTGDDLFTGEGGSGGDEAFFQVEIMPSFRGGDIGKFREWVGNRTNYPQAAIDNKIRGTVHLTFIVEKDGSVSNVTVVKGVDPLLDTEAVKAISESPKWTPGLQRGQPVRVRFSIPLNFSY
jgi:periplasmic protein TonB